MDDDNDADLPYIGARDWVDVVSRLDLPAAVPIGKAKVAAKTIKAIAFRCAWWADGKDGTRVHPGTARIVVTCDVDAKTAKRVVAILRGWGLLTLTTKSRGPQGSRGRVVSDEYRLTLPSDLLDRVRVMSPLEMDRKVAQVRESLRGKVVAGQPVPRNSTESMFDDAELRGTEYPATAEPVEGVAGYSVPPNFELRGNPFPSCGVTSTPPSISDQNTKEIDDDAVPAKPPTARRARKPRTPPPSVVKCEPHGLAAGLADDGSPRCPLCRRDRLGVAS